MPSSNQLRNTTIILLVLTVVIILPLLTLGMRFGGMMGYDGMMGRYGTTNLWWPLIGMLAQLIILFLLLGAVYLIFSRLTKQQASRDPALEELRLAYARGDISDEEFETRREKLKQSE